MDEQSTSSECGLIMRRARGPLILHEPSRKRLLDEICPRRQHPHMSESKINLNPVICLRDVKTIGQNSEQRNPQSSGALV